MRKNILRLANCYQIAMDRLKKSLSKKQLFLFLAFILVGIIASAIPFTKIDGSASYFSFFEFTAPSLAGIISLPAALVATLIIKLIMLFLNHGSINALFDIVRLLTPLAAVAVFYKKSKFNLLIPLIAIIAFLLHPVGREVWYYALFWTVPFIMHFLRDKFVFARSLGATFSQHAVGGVFFIYLFSTSAEFWTALIPVVIQERLIIALGITVSYQMIKEIMSLRHKQKAKEAAPDFLP